MIQQEMIRSPKRGRSSNTRSSADLYHYYAGFSPKFVMDIITGIRTDNNAVIMDPWNGSGTTTQVARDMGFSVIGFDINPVMVIVAKAKLLNCTKETRGKLLDNLNSIIRIASSFQNEKFPYKDPLEDWLEHESAMYFRDLERAVHLMLVGDKYNSIYAEKSLVHISNLAAFFYLALFKTLRSFLTAYVSSNPTWIKISSAKNDFINPTANEICVELQNQVLKMNNFIDSDRVGTSRINQGSVKIERASSDSIPLPNSSIDLVICSPPYCTRIDYAIATSPELALLGCSMNKDIKILRNSMIGTPTLIKKIPEFKSDWGPTCRSFLRSVETHNSKASKSYYYRYHVQYFNSIYESFLEIDRTLVKSGKCVIVVQDSYYKNIHNDLPRIFCEMAASLGWSTVDRLNFEIKQTMANCNKEVKKYRSSPNATESVLVFNKER